MTLLQELQGSCLSEQKQKRQFSAVSWSAFPKNRPFSSSSRLLIQAIFIISTYCLCKWQPVHFWAQGSSYAPFSTHWVKNRFSGCTSHQKSGAASPLPAVLSELQFFNYCAKVKTDCSENAYLPRSGALRAAQVRAGGWLSIRGRLGCRSEHLGSRSFP